MLVTEIGFNEITEIDGMKVTDYKPVADISGYLNGMEKHGFSRASTKNSHREYVAMLEDTSVFDDAELNMPFYHFCPSTSDVFKWKQITPIQVAKYAHLLSQGKKVETSL